MGVGDRIVRFREQNKMQQKELAEKIRMDPAVLNRIEKNRRPLRSDELSDIAKVFGITTDELLGRPAPKPGYYLDEETARIANEMKDRPELKTLFDASRRLRPEDISEVDALIQAKLKRPEYDEMGDGDFSE